MSSWRRCYKSGCQVFEKTLTEVVKEPIFCIGLFLHIIESCYNKIMFKKIYIILIIIFIVVLSLSGFFWISQQQKRLEVDFLDVGQGDAILIKSPFGQNILIDGGPDSTILKRLGERLPWWERTIDLMILTHPHDDHVMGLNEVIKRYDVLKIVHTGAAYDSPAYTIWQEFARDNKIPTVLVDRPQMINLGENCNLAILYPRQEIYGRGAENLNNTSIVSKLDCSGVKILFAGDAEREEENELLKTNIDLSAGIIKIGHHGSDTASGDAFLAKVKPQYAIVEVGENNFGLPSLRVIKRLERMGVKVYRTDQSGTIFIKNEKQNIKVFSER